MACAVLGSFVNRAHDDDDAGGHGRWDFGINSRRRTERRGEAYQFRPCRQLVCRLRYRDKAQTISPTTTKCKLSSFAPRIQTYLHTCYPTPQSAVVKSGSVAHSHSEIRTLNLFYKGQNLLLAKYLYFSQLLRRPVLNSVPYNFQHIILYVMSRADCFTSLH